MTKQVRRPNVAKGVLVPLGNGFSLAIGKHPEKTDDIDIGPNNKNGLSVNHGEILQNTGDSVRVFSAEPILGGQSPAQLLYGGANPNAVFAAQEHWKDVHKINDDGTRQAKYGKNVLRKIKNKLNNLINNSNSLLNKSNTLSPVKEGEKEKNQGIDWSGIKTTNNRSYDSNCIDYINKGLISRGVGKNQRAAIIANIIEESGGNPFAVDSTKKFKGLLQWEESRYWPGDEKDVYKEIDNQLDYIVNTAGNATDRKSWTHGGKGSGYNSLTDAMAAYNSEDDLEAAMKGYTLGYVRPAGGINSYNNRLKVAQQLSALEGFEFGGRKQFQIGGEDDNDGFKIVKQRNDFKPTKFKSFLRRLYASDNSDTAVNRYGDFSRMYFGLPLQNSLLYESNYKPTISKNLNTKYYGVTDGKFIHDIIELYNHPGPFEKPHIGVVDGYSTKGPKIYPWQGEYLSDDLGRDLANHKKIKLGRTPHTLGPGALGNFTISRGKDEKGEYLSYYDIWDVDPKRSKNAEKRGFAKPYEIYDRIYGTFDDDGTFHPKGEIPAAVITANKKFGGQITKQSLGERPNAKFGKEMENNKRQRNYLGSGNLKTLADINAAKEKLGNYYSTFYNPDGTVKKAMPTFGQLQGTTFTPAEQKMYKKIWGEDFYNKNVSGSGQFVGAFGDKLSVPTTNLTGTDQYGNTIGTNGQITKLAAPKTKLPPRSTVGSIGGVGRSRTKGSFFNSQAGADLIGAGINAVGSIASAIINNKYADKLKFTPREAVHYNPVKLKTKINIAPQITQMKEMRAKLQDAAVKTSGSSRTAYQKILAGHNSLLESAMNLYGQKENQETQLINQDRLNQQSVAHKNAKEFIDTVNYNATGRDNLENTRAQLKAQNAVSTINNLAGIINGPQGLLARKEARNSQLANLAVMSAAYPDAIKLMQGDGWEKRLNGLRNLVNNGYWG